MQRFRFYDTDATGQEEYDISGTQYYELLHTCFKYCTTVAVIVFPWFSGSLELWEDYRIPINENVVSVFSHYGASLLENEGRTDSYEIRHYKLDALLQKKILEHTDRMFNWTSAWGNNNPDDISFFRKDGSVFFSSIIHEGECTLFPKANEDVEGIVTSGNWIKLPD